jgi:hypothetical protein
LYSSVYGAYITREITGDHYSLGHPATPDDPQASLRAQLAAKISGAQSDLENQLAKLRDMSVGLAGSDALAQLQGQLRGLSQLQQRIALADPAALVAIRGEVTAYVAATQAMVRQAQPGNAAFKSGVLALREASEAAQKTTTDFMHSYYEQHTFDKFLKFSSPEDEEEFRRREEERRREIEKARAENTPAGNLRALDLAIAQMKDAGAHGADRSKDYQPQLDALEASRQALAKQVEKSGAGVTSPTKDASATKDAASTPTPLPSDLLAAIRTTKMEIADQSITGHGVGTKSAATPDARGRG